MEESKVVFDSVKVQELLPHRYPFLLIDKVVEFIPNERIVCIKNVSINEEYFVGHFPGHPVMPGVLILEAIAQAAAVLSRASPGGVPLDRTVYLVGAENVKWKKRVVPGDTLRIDVRLVKFRRPLWILEGEVTVDGVVVASGTVQACEG